MPTGAYRSADWKEKQRRRQPLKVGEPYKKRGGGRYLIGTNYSIVAVSDRSDWSGRRGADITLIITSE